MRSIFLIRERWASTLSVAVLGLLLLLPASPHGAELVLCLEESGQVNVERAKSGKCVDWTRTNGESELLLLDTSENEHCTDCSDVPLRLTEADDPCETAILSSPPSPEGPSEQIAFASTGLDRQVVETDESGHSFLKRFRQARPTPDPDASIGSVVLLI